MRLHQCILIGSAIVGSWLGMQAIHETGHVLGAWLTGGRIERVVWHPLTISRTDLVENPQPLLVAWAGPAFGVLGPLLLWGLAITGRWRGAFLLRFFAGFCLVANGLYISVGSLDRIGDAGDLLRYDAMLGHCWLFGMLTVPIGFRLWHNQGPHFGLGTTRGHVDRHATWACTVACLIMLVIGFVFGGAF